MARGQKTCHDCCQQAAATSIDRQTAVQPALQKLRLLLDPHGSEIMTLSQAYHSDATLRYALYWCMQQHVQAVYQVQDIRAVYQLRCRCSAADAACSLKTLPARSARHQLVVARSCQAANSILFCNITWQTNGIKMAFAGDSACFTGLLKSTST